MPAQLVALNDGPSIWLDKPILLIGRHPECDIQIDSRKISRRHCCIAQVADYLVIRDLGSTNGIRINGDRVLEGRLKPGDELTIGNHRYRVHWDSIAPNGGARGQFKDTLRSANQPVDDAMLEGECRCCWQSRSVRSLPPAGRSRPRRRLRRRKRRKNRSSCPTSWSLASHSDIFPASPGPGRRLTGRRREPTDFFPNFREPADPRARLNGVRGGDHPLHRKRSSPVV